MIPNFELVVTNNLTVAQWSGDFEVNSGNGVRTLDNPVLYPETGRTGASKREVPPSSNI